MSDYYSVLGLPKSASLDEIKKAYKKLALKYHPDKQTGSDTEKFKEISEAYSILSDPNKKSLYDRFGKDGLKQQPIMFNPFEAFGIKILQRVNLMVTLEDVLAGLTKTVTIGRNDIKIDLPPGVLPGMEVRHDNFVFRINYAPHEKYTVTKTDLNITLDIDLVKVLCGGSLDVPLLGGGIKNIEFDQLDINKPFKINGQGLPIIETGKRGNLLVSFKTRIPIIEKKHKDQIRQILKRYIP